MTKYDVVRYVKFKESAIQYFVCVFFFSLCTATVRALEKAKGNNQLQTSYSSDSSLYTNRKGSAVSAFDGGSDSSSESEPDEPPNRKKLRVEAS